MKAAPAWQGQMVLPPFAAESGCRQQPGFLACTAHSRLVRSVEEYGTCDPLWGKWRGAKVNKVTIGQSGRIA
jgi:hypothetical protein